MKVIYNRRVSPWTHHKALNTAKDSPSRLNSQAACKLNVKHTLSDIDRVRTTSQHPLLASHIPCAEILPGQIKLEVDALARVNPLLTEAAKLLWWCTRYTNIKLGNFGRSDIASVGDGAVDRCDDVPKCGQASCSDCAVGSSVCRADITKKLNLQGGIVESGVCQPISKLKAGGDVLRNESLVVNVHTLGEVGLGVVVTSVIRDSWVEQRAIVGSLLCDGVWKTPRWGLLAVHDLHQRLSAVLTRKMGVYDSGDIRVIDPGVNNSDASVVNDDNSVIALRCNVLDKNIRVLIGKYISVPT